MDINKELESLLMKYDIGKLLPFYQNMFGDNGKPILGHKMDEDFYCRLKCEIERESKKLREAQNIVHLVDAIQRLIVLFVYGKDFVNSFQLTEIYIRKRYEGFECYQQFRRDLKRLFQQITCSLKGRKGTVCYWLSPFGRGWEQEIPYLKKVSLESLHFGYVNSAHNWEEGIIERNSQPAALGLWGLLEKMLVEDKRGMYMVYIPTNIYIPWVFPVFYEKYCNGADGGCQIINSGEYDTEKYTLARQYVDKQLRFYDSLLGDGVTRIYMGDKK